ncbi:MAG: aminoglycoside phosphotransferase family protein [Anaerolineae bacterium]|nr:aminoglycoside phosphotransferase family protein [Anaerolineae bacterium]
MMLRTLLDHLADRKPTQADQQAGYCIQPLVGGHNNLLYRATNHDHDLVVKFTIRDTRDRAGREFEALTALQEAGLSIAPVPIYMDRDGYALPVIVQSYLEGAVSAEPCADDEEWNDLITYYAMLHSVNPDNVQTSLRGAVLSMYSAEQAKLTLYEQLARLPANEHPPELGAILASVEQRRWPTWRTPPIRLSRSDPNPSNFVRCMRGWKSVDWENSGWGDPAFEIADMMTHPAYMSVTAERWEWVIAAYCRAVGDPNAEVRIRTYYALMLAWWVVRFARYLYELPRGVDRRLVTLAPDWHETTQQKYTHYVQLARQQI